MTFVDRLKGIEKELASVAELSGGTIAFDSGREFTRWWNSPEIIAAMFLANVIESAAERIAVAIEGKS